ncbi:hypothetical protein M2459_002617 [Parabacteroides sp. PF5-5]|nr:hypothetical protein [Parabacteroides sp. PH5-39]MDH6316955.1 hypothetical protein [Parabacteroides sp. PF5-13]MDH6321025.1 hypothetical protein [Parabacteroides sp. PH5-13]MDH6324757.1 hypothetical protein [Parabacteroides sp. PH5-8]MDH6328140.1 hypothetical protein [Parabacteroides sp. PH5-41]MDH6335852.1 hypothetical protein [Parabacteroides sp. PF5-5]MDH6347006.1 hypothetical protein [Parabacteroides sp. PH5-46]MDH6361968.1 hypothetical protein [Parabacteroides sp. PH5-16]MDH6377636.
MRAVCSVLCSMAFKTIFLKCQIQPIFSTVPYLAPEYRLIWSFELTICQSCYFVTLPYFISFAFYNIFLTITL